MAHNRKLNEEEVKQALSDIEEMFKYSIEVSYEKILKPHLKVKEESFVKFEIGTYILFRIDLFIFKNNVDNKFREFINLIAGSYLGSLVGAFDDILDELIDIRLNRYLKVVKATGYGTNDFIDSVNSFALSLIKRASETNRVADWELGEKEMVKPAGISLEHIISPNMEEIISNTLQSIKKTVDLL